MTMGSSWRGVWIVNVSCVTRLVKVVGLGEEKRVG